MQRVATAQWTDFTRASIHFVSATLHSFPPEFRHTRRTRYRQNFLHRSRTIHARKICVSQYTLLKARQKSPLCVMAQVHSPTGFVLEALLSSRKTSRQCNS